jgi:hypothetical protein
VADDGTRDVQHRAEVGGPRNWDVVWERSTNQLLIYLAGGWVTIGKERPDGGLRVPA